MIPVVYLDHGAALFSVQANSPLRKNLNLLTQKSWWKKVERIVIVSAHNSSEDDQFHVGTKPEFWADHPASQYIETISPISDEVFSELVFQTLQNFGLKVQKEKGKLDHGAWIPLSAFNSEGNLPITTVSTIHSQKIEDHIKAGNALYTLRESGTLLLFSGGISHNQEEFRNGYFSGGNIDEASELSRSFTEWTLKTTKLESEARLKNFKEWKSVYGADYAQPEPSHWYPFLMAIGAAKEDKAEFIYTGYQFGLSTSIICFEN